MDIPREIDFKNHLLIGALEILFKGWAWWLTPVIPALWEAEAGRSPDVRSSRPAWPTLWNPISTKNIKCKPGTEAHAYNPSTLGGRGRWITRSRDRDHPGQQDETLSLLKIQKISWAWWCVPVVPTTQEAEAGELLKPRRQRLQWAEIVPLHSSLGNNSETPSQKIK